uniref:Uncharacterized protein n=1 Tax=Arundo donax TaxID=35708 RepID=A0A0A9DRY6_ARUDO
MKQFSIALLQWYSLDGYLWNLPTCIAQRKAVLHVVQALWMDHFLVMKKDTYNYLI